MEELNYVVDNSRIVELLGLQNFSTSESAILELVKNAYDARAFNLTLSFHDNILEIIDDGDGMNDSDIRNHWMHIGKSEKGYQVVDENNNIRVQSGSKGVGRFALSRLGCSIVITSKKNGYDTVVWKTDWVRATVENITEDRACGTHITIGKLREKWSDKKIGLLCKYLELTYKDSSMVIDVEFANKKMRIPQHFPLGRPGVNCKSLITLNYENGVIITKVDSDEFKEEASVYCEGINLTHYENSINVFDELKNTELEELVGEDLSNYISELGGFSATFFFNITPTGNETEKFLYKYRNTPESVDGGVVLYRNAFSISSYEGSKDWLGLGKRSRKSPAAASHSTGAWRIRENQIAGYVDIDKNRNAHLNDLANRQGLEENEYYQLFINIILMGLADFERYRQSIIREITKNFQVDVEETPIIDKVIKKPSVLSQLSKEEVKSLANEIKDTRKSVVETIRIKDETEARYKYDVRILNVLATMGLKASSIAHEMNNDMNMLNSWYSLTVEALKEYDMWEDLNSSDNTKLAYKNVPELLSNANGSTQRIILFMKTMLDEIEKKQFEVKTQEVEPLLNSIIDTWKRDYAWISISVRIEEGIEYHVSEDVLQVVFDNLILNTVQQNEKKDHVNITIMVRKSVDCLQFDYFDDGVGLDKKYLNNPMRILEVHETTRRNGHGLGMWIVNNTCVMSGGEVQAIDSNNGFHISFAIGGGLNG